MKNIVVEFAIFMFNVWAQIFMLKFTILFSSYLLSSFLALFPFPKFHFFNYDFSVFFYYFVHFNSVFIVLIIFVNLYL